MPLPPLLRFEISPLTPELTQISPLEDCYVESLSLKESDQQHNTTTINDKMQNVDQQRRTNNDNTLNKIGVIGVQNDNTITLIPR